MKPITTTITPRREPGASLEAAGAHSPAPWNVEHPYGEPGVYVGDARTGLVAKLYKPSEVTGGDIEANARLIAAAPDLLAALVALADAVALANVRPGIPTMPEYMIARAAIAKAEGGK